MMTTLLRTLALSLRYGGLFAVDGVDMNVQAGSVHALIGPNGAGKTALFNLISGLVQPSEGTVLFRGLDVTSLAADRRTALGLARTFQISRIFGAMTVLENVLVGLQPRCAAGLLATILRTQAFRGEERALVARARDALHMVGLSAHAEAPAATLSLGERRMLEIARAIAPEPALLLLDEPAAGMSTAEIYALASLVRRIRDLGTTVLLVEHNMGLVLDIADVVTVLDVGRCIFQGAPAAARQAPEVIEAYLGPRMAARLAARTPRMPV